MRNYDITQVLWHETGKMSHLNIFQNKKKKEKEIKWKMQLLCDFHEGVLNSS